MNVYTEYDKWSRTGNRLFQYAFAHLLAREKKCKLFAEEIPEFNIADNSARSSDRCEFTRRTGMHYVDMDHLIATDRDVIVNSFVQKAQYYAKDRDYLKTVIKPAYSRKIELLPTYKDCLVLHIRETDYVNINCFLGYQFYKDLIRDSGLNDVMIVTDNSECDTVKRLMADGCRVNTHGTIKTFNTSLDDRSTFDFMTMLSCENLALSQSSFSWWAAFLGNHKRVIFPFRKSVGIWPIIPNKDDIDLFFDAPGNQKYIHD